MRTSNGHDNGHATDEMLDQVYAFWPAATPAPQPCPEAALSCTIEGLLDGHKTLLTARGQTPEEFLRNLKAVRGLLDPATPPVVEGPIKDFCVQHKVRMYLNQKDGRSWYSHRTPEGTFCKGK
jgi:hypothetical protein